MSLLRRLEALERVMLAQHASDAALAQQLRELDAICGDDSRSHEERRIARQQELSLLVRRFSLVRFVYASFGVGAAELERDIAALLEAHAPRRAAELN